MRMVNRLKVGRVKASAKGRINGRRKSGIIAKRASLLVGDRVVPISILPTRRAFLLMRTASKKGRSRAERMSEKEGPGPKAFTPPENSKLSFIRTCTYVVV